MSKKHFIALAAEIQSTFGLDRPWLDIEESVRMAALDAVGVICRVAIQDNPRFDEHRFRVACGVWVN